jgi:hypothetical protein
MKDGGLGLGKPVRLRFYEELLKTEQSCQQEEEQKTLWKPESLAKIDWF